MTEIAVHASRGSAGLAYSGSLHRCFDDGASNAKHGARDPTQRRSERDTPSGRKAWRDSHSEVEDGKCHRLRFPAVTMRHVLMSRSSGREPGRTTRMSGRATFEDDGKDIGDDEDDRLLGVLRVDEIAVELHRLELLEGEARAVVGEVQGHVRTLGQRVPVLLVRLGLGASEDRFDLFARHGGQRLACARRPRKGHSTAMKPGTTKSGPDSGPVSSAPDTPTTPDSTGSTREGQRYAQEPPEPMGTQRVALRERGGDGRSPLPDEIVVLRDVRKSFGKQEVLKGIDLVARRRETTVIIGGSGAGKTTLLRLIIALERVTSGNVYIDGEDITVLSERELNRIRKKFGMVYQYAALLDSISVYDNVAFPLVENTKLSKKEIADRVMAKLEILGLDPKVVAPKFPSELSGGMRKRVGLARALMLEPPILIYDEPTSGLDPLTSRLVDDLIEEMRQRFGVTSIVISHDIASCFRIAHQAVLVIQGRVEASGPPDALLDGPSEVAREFVRNSGVDVDSVGRVTR